ncbi:hypothetical protein [Halosimplex pelagicum]|uniref:Uncharacterized protein n=1 Tax=Halosimplex pelagicum TaxID=869886 RepID=A0A7D5SXQ7_9EURY|nr:hypothetical protein [Halosimplex pelagicum]QLH84147.1 hypothetical protein HZS54_22025 [Halosimplex pelagicum]
MAPVDGPDDPPMESSPESTPGEPGPENAPEDSAPADSAPAGSASDGDQPAGAEPDTGGASDDPPPDEGRSRRRRILLLLLLVLLVFVGGGLGTFVLDGFPDGSPGPGTPSATPAPAPNATGNVSLATVANATLLRADGVVPGEEGVSRLRLRNTGTARGELSVTGFDVESDENGLLPPESPVDDSPEEGELDEHLVVRVSAEYPGGETAAVYGDEGFVPIGSLEAGNRTIGDGLAAGEDVTIVVEWRLPAGTGNEVQSDSVTFDIGFTLRSVNGTATPQ